MDAFVSLLVIFIASWMLVNMGLRPLVRALRAKRHPPHPVTLAQRRQQAIRTRRMELACEIGPALGDGAWDQELGLVAAPVLHNGVHTYGTTHTTDSFVRARYATYDEAQQVREAKHQQQLFNELQRQRRAATGPTGATGSVGFPAAYADDSIRKMEALGITYEEMVARIVAMQQHRSRLIAGYAPGFGFGPGGGGGGVKR